MKKRMKEGTKILTILAIVAVMVTIISPGGGVAQAGGPWYVAPTGNDANDCLSSATACQTIQAAIGKASSGDTINVAAGTYNENLNINKNNLTLQGQDKNTTQINVTASYGIQINANGVTFDGFTVKQNAPGTVQKALGIMGGTTDNTVSNCVFDGTGSTKSGSMGIVVRSSNHTIDNVESFGWTGYGIDVYSGGAPYADNVVIKNSYFHDNAWFGIAVDRSTNVKVQDNRITGAGNNGIAFFEGAGAPVTGSEASGNAIQGPFTYNGILLVADGVTISNNEICDVSNAGTGAIRVTTSYWPYYSADNNTIANNYIHNNDIGVLINFGTYDEPTGNVFYGNSFVDNTTPFDASESTQAVNASGNWWGTNTATGVAAAAGSNADYTPWLDVGTDTSGDTGFQGDFSVLHVDDDSPQSGTTGRIQEGINMVSSSTVLVYAGTYNERLTINKSVDLRGAQYGVDPTAAGARTNPADESVITEAGLSTPNPDVLIEVPSGVTNVTVDGFTLEGDRTNTTADTSVVRCWDDNITISHNIIDGMYGVLYKGGDTLMVHHNRMVVNKAGVVVQPNPASNVTVSDNIFNLGSGPIGDESAFYMTSCGQCSATGNTATGFSGRGIGGSNLHHLTISGNTLTGNRDAISIWGSSTFITIMDNILADSSRYGINIKGQDVDITGNEITNNGDVGINIDRHVIDTERVEIHQNNIAGNTNYGVQVNTALVTEIVDATCNWWGAVDGPSGSGPGSGDAVSDKVYFQPWLTQAAPSACDYEGPLTHNVAPSTVAVNTPVILNATVNDTDTGGSYIASAEYKLDDDDWVPMNAQDGSFFDQVIENVVATISAFETVGIHEVCVRGTDAAGNTGPKECILLAIYDPDGGFVTGGGWIDSPAGAYTPDPSLTGKATFGFVSKYKKGAQTPEGQTEFVFRAADLNFHSDSYDWLVVAGAKAMFKGIGTINGEGLYKFMLTAIDADINENDSFDVDRFRIKIWDEVDDTEHVIYDNGLDGDEDDDNATTEIGGGSIVIHTKKK